MYIHNTHMCNRVESKSHLLTYMTHWLTKQSGCDPRAEVFLKILQKRSGMYQFHIAIQLQTSLFWEYPKQDETGLYTSIFELLVHLENRIFRHYTIQNSLRINAEYFLTQHRIHLHRTQGSLTFQVPMRYSNTTVILKPGSHPHNLIYGWGLLDPSKSDPNDLDCLGHSNLFNQDV